MENEENCSYVLGVILGFVLMKYILADATNIDPVLMLMTIVIVHS